VVDWSTVALSSIGSLGGILLTILLEHRRETLQHLAAADRRLEAMDGRVRHAEQKVATFRPAHQAFAELASGDLMRKLRRVGGR
jgi:hypothetical protein